MPEAPSTRPLLDKLGVKPGMRIAVLGVVDPPFLADLRQRIGEYATEPVDHADVVFVAINEPDDLIQLGPLKQSIKRDGMIWAVFRKGRKDFNENHVLRGGLAAGLVDVKVVRFSDTHSASRFVIRKAER
jgi:hypothetical protein